MIYQLPLFKVVWEKHDLSATITQVTLEKLCSIKATITQATAQKP